MKKQEEGPQALESLAAKEKLAEGDPEKLMGRSKLLSARAAAAAAEHPE